MNPPQTPVHRRTLSALGHELLTPFLLGFNTPSMHLSPSLLFSPSRLFGNQSDFQGMVGDSHLRKGLHPSPKHGARLVELETTTDSGPLRELPEITSSATTNEDPPQPLHHGSPGGAVSDAEATDEEDPGISKYTPPDSNFKERQEVPGRSPMNDITNTLKRKAMTLETPVKRQIRAGWDDAALIAAVSRHMANAPPATPNSASRRTQLQELAAAYSAGKPPRYHKTSKQVENRLKHLWKALGFTPAGMSRYLALDVPHISDRVFDAFLSSSPYQEQPLEVQIGMADLSIRFRGLDGLAHTFAHTDNGLPQASDITGNSRCVQSLLLERPDLPLLLVQCGLAIPEPQHPSPLSRLEGTLDAQVVLKATLKAVAGMLTWKVSTRVYDDTDTLIMVTDEYVNAYKNLEVALDEYRVRMPFVATFWKGYLTYVMNATVGGTPGPLGLKVVQVVYDEDVRHVALVYLFNRGTGSVLVQLSSVAEWTLQATPPNVPLHSSDHTEVVQSPEGPSPIDGITEQLVPLHHMFQEQFLQQQQFLELQRQQQMQLQMRLQMQMQVPLPDMYYQPPPPPQRYPQGFMQAPQMPLGVPPHGPPGPQLPQGYHQGFPQAVPLTGSSHHSLGLSTPNTSMSAITPPLEKYRRYNTSEFRVQPLTVKEMVEHPPVVQPLLGNRLQFEFYQPPVDK